MVAVQRALMVLIVLGAAVHALSYAYVSSDDAFISLRYARNLAEGHGLVYNPGGPRVEGLSNPLFSTCNAVLIRIGMPPVWAMKLVGFAAYLVTVALVPRLVIADEDDRPSLWGLAAAAALAASAFPALWSVAGLETAFHAMLIVIGALLVTRECRRGRPGWSPVVFALIAANRPEGAMLGVVAFVVQWWFLGTRLRLFVHWFVGMGLPCAGLLGLRYLYFGMLVPNTYTVKALFGPSATSRGTTYLLDFFLYGGFWVVVPAALGLVIGFGRWMGRSETVLPLALVIAHGAFVVLVGGDFMPGYRFVMPVYPLLCALTASAGASLTERLPIAPRMAVAGGAVLVLAAGSLLTQSWGLDQHGRRSWLLHDRPWWTYLPQTDVKGTWLEGHQEVAEYVRSRAEPNDLLAVTEAGVMPFFARLPVLDMLGLNDRTVAELWRGRPGENVSAAASMAVIRKAWQKRLRTVADHILSKEPRWIVLDGHFDPVTGKFVPRLPIGPALMESKDWRCYRQVFQAEVYGAAWSDSGMRPRINVVFDRGGSARPGRTR